MLNFFYFILSWLHPHVSDLKIIFFFIKIKRQLLRFSMFQSVQLKLRNKRWTLMSLTFESSPPHLAAREDAQAAGTLVVQETSDKILVMRLLHSLHHVLQRVGDIWLLQQRQDELTAPPAGQVVQRQQSSARPLKRPETWVYVVLMSERWSPVGFCSSIWPVCPRVWDQSVARADRSRYVGGKAPWEGAGAETELLSPPLHSGAELPHTERRPGSPESEAPSSEHSTRRKRLIVIIQEIISKNTKLKENM